MKEYQIIYMFGDITDTIKAKNKEDAEQKANEKLNTDDTPIKDAYVYGIEVEELENA